MPQKNRLHNISENQTNLFPDNKKAGYKKSAFSILPTFEIEMKLISQGYTLIAGIDEAGRGALAGPLSVGMVIFSSDIINKPPELITENVNDSKKLTRLKRESLSDIIDNHSLASEYIFISAEIIDDLNINRATEYGVSSLLERASLKPDIIIMDGNFNFKFQIPMIPVKGGDSKSLTIAAASIKAKVTRDKLMNNLDAEYPGYSLKNNKGYGTSSHMEAIRQKGYTKVHRKTYAPVRDMINNTGSIFNEVQFK